METIYETLLRVLLNSNPEATEEDFDHILNAMEDHINFNIKSLIQFCTLAPFGYETMIMHGTAWISIESLGLDAEKLVKDGIYKENVILRMADWDYFIKEIIQDEWLSSSFEWVKEEDYEDLKDVVIIMHRIREKFSMVDIQFNKEYAIKKL